jgi:hypothetical protein
MTRSSSLSFAEHIAALGSTLELWWFQRIVDFDSSDQIEALKSAFGAWRKMRGRASPDDVPDGRSLADFQFEDLDLGKALLALLIASSLGGLLVTRARRRTGRALPWGYTRALVLLRRRGLVRGPSDTARQFAARVSQATSATCASAFGAITEAYLAERFGARLDLQGSEAELEQLKQALESARS